MPRPGFGYELTLGIAAGLLGGKADDWGLLHYDLCDTICEAAEMVRGSGGEFVDRQVIAGIITIWKKANPGARAFGE